MGVMSSKFLIKDKINKTLSVDSIKHQIERNINQEIDDFSGLECELKLRTLDPNVNIVYHDCSINYITCPNRNCIKNLV